jgi:hypothetical protein
LTTIRMHSASENTVSGNFLGSTMEVSHSEQEPGTCPAEQVRNKRDAHILWLHPPVLGWLKFPCCVIYFALCALPFLCLLNISHWFPLVGLHLPPCTLENQKEDFISILVLLYSFICCLLNFFTCFISICQLYKCDISMHACNILWSNSPLLLLFLILLPLLFKQF